MKILGIIPARGGSKRVPQKNFRPFAGTTLTDLAIRQALESELLDSIILSSDSDDVLAIASKYEKVLSLKRPSKISEDDSPALDYMRHSLEHYRKQGEFFDLVAIIQPSSPLRKGADIDATIRMLIENPDADSAVSIVRIPHMIHPYKIKILDGSVLEPWLVNEEGKTAAHEIPELYVRNCAVYVFKSENLKKEVTYGEKCLGYLMPPETSVDINDMVDFQFAEYLVMKQAANVNR